MLKLSYIDPQNIISVMDEENYQTLRPVYVFDSFYDVGDEISPRDFIEEKDFDSLILPIFHRVQGDADLQLLLALEENFYSLAGFDNYDLEKFIQFCFNCVNFEQSPVNPLDSFSFFPESAYERNKYQIDQTINENGEYFCDYSPMEIVEELESYYGRMKFFVQVAINRISWELEELRSSDFYKNR